jgi:hypothetical protein
VDVPADVRAQADGLVAQGNGEMVENFQYWFDESGSWWDAKARSPQAALNHYEQALEVAPGHCQAIFGRAMASASMITRDEKMDNFVRRVEELNQDGGEAAVAKRAGFAALFKLSPEEAAPALMKLSATLDQVEKPLVVEAQELIESAILPKLDSTIAALESIMDYQMFAVRFGIDGDSVEIDRGEIGPGLAGLKVAKAWLTVVAGHNIDPSLDGNYDWIEDLQSIRIPDYDHLSPAQTRALNHLTGMFKVGSPITRVKNGWKDRIEGIPALLVSAAGDAQRGLESVIAEVRNGEDQGYDLWRAGSGEDADVDTADLRNVIKALDITKKYLAGEQTIAYSRGSRTLKVNFARLFHQDGLQNNLPYFEFNDFAAWNDTVRADTAWGDSYMWGETQREMIDKAGFGEAQRVSQWEPVSWSLQVRATPVMVPGTPQDTTFQILLYRWDSSLNGGGPTTLANLVQDPQNPCEFSLERFFSLEIDPADANQVTLVSEPSQAALTLGTCREVDGRAQYVSWIDAETLGPIRFTDKEGNPTILPHEFNGIEDPIELKGKVIFRDPTFGGVLPEMSNESFWEHVSAISNSGGSRVVRTCEEIQTEEGWWDYRCTSTLPENPSDLDYLHYYLNWTDDVM